LTGSTPRRGRDVSRETSRPGAEHDRVIRAIIARARAASALAHHCNDPRYCDGPGLPDVILMGIGGPAFIEVKTGSGQPRPDQTDWLCMFRAAGASAMLCGPEDLENGNVDALIQAITAWPPPIPGSGSASS
jgi:hypothetical protein